MLEKGYQISTFKVPYSRDADIRPSPSMVLQQKNPDFWNWFDFKYVVTATVGFFVLLAPVSTHSLDRKQELLEQLKSYPSMKQALHLQDICWTILMDLVRKLPPSLNFAVGDEYYEDLLVILQRAPLKTIRWHRYRSAFSLVHRQDMIFLYDVLPEDKEIRAPLMLANSLQKDVTAVEWKPKSGSVLAVACRTGVCLWRIKYPPPKAATPFTASQPPLFESTTPTEMEFLSYAQSGQFTSLSWSPDGQMLVGASATSPMMVVWDFMSVGTPIRPPGGGGTKFVAFSPDGQYLLQICILSKMWIWETTKWTCVELVVRSPCQCAVWTPTGNRIIFALQGDSSLYAVSVEKGPPLTTRLIIPERTANFKFGRHGRLTPSKKEVIVGGPIEGLAMDPSGSRLAISFVESELVLLARMEFASGIPDYFPLGFIRGPYWDAADTAIPASPYQPNIKGASISRDLVPGPHALLSFASYQGVVVLSLAWEDGTVQLVDSSAGSLQLSNIPAVLPARLELISFVMLSHIVDENRFDFPVEIIEAILEKATKEDGSKDWKCLYSCALVSKTWNECTLRLLYETIPPRHDSLWCSYLPLDLILANRNAFGQDALKHVKRLEYQGDAHVLTHFGPIRHLTVLQLTLDQDQLKELFERCNILFVKVSLRAADTLAQARNLSHLYYHSPDDDEEDIDEALIARFMANNPNVKIKLDVDVSFRPSGPLLKTIRCLKIHTFECELPVQCALDALRASSSQTLEVFRCKASSFRKSSLSRKHVYEARDWDFMAFPNLKKVTMNFDAGLVNYHHIFFGSLASEDIAAKLEYLDVYLGDPKVLRKASYVVDKLIERHARSLKTLKMTDIPESIYTYNFGHLERLKVPSNTLEIMMLLRGHGRHLTNLDIGEWRNHEDIELLTVDAIVQSCPKLVDISIPYGKTGISETDVELMATELQSLRYLTLHMPYTEPVELLKQSMELIATRRSKEGFRVCLNLSGWRMDDRTRVHIYRLSKRTVFVSSRKTPCPHNAARALQAMNRI
ncbi:hypothetical protein SmJEL517_g01593 [Synchytrium microbalum]|uniref:Uncharacterized protein n=1 Tax=Synchytrium microbalum TaxID=1806994 RepID=A0A507C3L9_9FUNG|nr:uncharacterized protein SmJEL517_g01593 [Synchytrium microbalum]TPX36120.1 hypothetical protein SmJEL517_g01593 [Synchytrium microbalum]